MQKLFCRMMLDHELIFIFCLVIIKEIDEIGRIFF